METERDFEVRVGKDGSEFRKDPHEIGNLYTDKHLPFQVSDTETRPLPS